MRQKHVFMLLFQLFVTLTGISHEKAFSTLFLCGPVQD